MAAVAEHHEEPHDEVTAFDFSRLPPTIHAIIHEDAAALDPDAEHFLPKLRQSAAPEIWHKHGSFYNHLHDVWSMLCAWGQPRAICRLGLFHSAYSNSFVSMNLFDPDTPAGRAELRELIGPAAEELVYKFCVIDRQSMEVGVFKEGRIPKEGITFKHIRTGEPVFCSAAEIGAFLVETIADYQDQSFGWQSDMEAGRSGALWPGAFKPTLRMHRVSKLASVAREYGRLEVVPPVFDGCTKILRYRDEEAARELYWQVVAERDCSAPGTGSSPGSDARGAVQDLLQASSLNPFVAEPHVVRAQLLMQLGSWAEAMDAAKSGLKIFYDWATQWDNRMPLQAWISWGRCILLQASLQEWPRTHGGVESLGAVNMSQRFRELSDDRTIGTSRRLQSKTSPAARL